MVIERYRRRVEQEKIEQYQQHLESVSPSLREILADPKLFGLLDLLLEQEYQKATKNQDEQDKQKIQTLREKLLKRETLAKNDFEKLKNYRDKIKEAVDASKEVLKLLDPKTIEIIAGSSESFKQLVEIIDIKNVPKFLEAYLARLYVTAPDKFIDLRGKIEAIKQAETELKNIDNELKAKCIEYGIPEPEIAKIYEESKEDEIRRLVKSRLNIFQRIYDYITGEKITTERVKELNKINEVANKLQQINENLKAIGEMIATVVFETEKGLDFASKAIYGEIKSEIGVDFKELQYSEEELNSEWEEYITEQLANQNKQWNQLNAQQKNLLRQEFIRRKRKEFGNKGGGFLEVFLKMIEEWVNTKL